MVHAYSVTWPLTLCYFLYTSAALMELLLYLKTIYIVND